MIRGYAGRILEIDLGDRTHAWKALDEDTARLYVGGKGYGTRLLYDMTEPGLDALGPDNPLIFATGPLNGSVAPQSNRFAVVCKSPLTGGIGNATCGGSFAYSMKRAGVDVIIVKGESREALRIEIQGDDDQVTFLPADDLWGKGTYETQADPRQEEVPRRDRAGGREPGALRRDRLQRAHRGTHRRGGGDGLQAAQGGERASAPASSTWRIRMQVQGLYQGGPRALQGSPRPRRERSSATAPAGILNTTNGRNILPTRNFQQGPLRRMPWRSRASGMEDNELKSA